MAIYGYMKFGDTTLNEALVSPSDGYPEHGLTCFIFRALATLPLDGDVANAEPIQQIG